MSEISSLNRNVCVSELLWEKFLEGTGSMHLLSLSLTFKIHRDKILSLWSIIVKSYWLSLD